MKPKLSKYIVEGGEIKKRDPFTYYDLVFYLVFVAAMAATIM